MTGLVVYRGGVINHGDRASRLEGNLNPLWRHQRSHFLHQRGDHTAGCTPQETCCMTGDSELVQDARDIQSLSSRTLGILRDAVNLTAGLIRSLPRNIQSRIGSEGPDHDSTSIPWLWNAKAAAPSA